MDFGNGEIERLVQSINPDETNDTVIRDIFRRFGDQSRGIQNKLISMMVKHLKNYGKQDLNVCMRQSRVQPLTVLDDEDSKPYLIIGDEIMEKFHIITLQSEIMEGKPIMMLFYNNSYHRKLRNVEKYISNRIVTLNVSHRHTFNDVLHYIQKQTLFDPEKLNYDPNIMVFKNGVYDFRVNKFVHDKEAWNWHYFYEIPHEYEKGRFDCPKFKKAVVKWLDKKTTLYHRKGNRIILLNDVFEAIGLCMTMHMGFKTSFLNYGEPHCGKSQFFNIIIHLLGRENISNTSLQRLGKNEFGAEGLEFRVLNYCGDLPSRKVEDHGTFKNITGGDLSVESERKGGSKHQVHPVCKFWFNANKVPRLGNWDDDAIYDRFIMFHFCNQFLENEVETINEFWTHITTDSNEIQGIIHEAIEGFKRLLKRGGFRQVLKKDTKHKWNYTSNQYYAFLFDHCEMNKKGKIEINEFQEKFTDFYPGTSKNAITRGLYSLGIEKKQARVKGTDDRNWYYIGLEWKDESIIQKEDIKLNYTIDKDFSDVGGIGYEF